MIRSTVRNLAGLGWAAVLALAPGATARAQVTCPLDGSGAISCPNQIEGAVEFTNTDPDVLPILAAEGFHSGTVQASSVGTAPPLHNSTAVAVSSPTTASYQITAQGGDPGNGIPYDLGATMFLDLTRAVYHFASARSAPLEKEPAPDVQLPLRECAGVFDVRWQTPDGTPVAVDGGFIDALRETAPGSGSHEFQARATILSGVSRQHVIARGDGSKYRVDIYFNTGSDPFSDQITRLHQLEVELPCDEIVEIVCVIPPGPTGELGRIVGRIDMLGESENQIGNHTFLSAGLGPFNNFRFDHIAQTPSRGFFELENLVPSDQTSPPTGYPVSAAMSFRLGRRAEYFIVPPKIGVNGTVQVGAGQTVDLGDTFVLDPGYVVGDIELLGPPPGELGACLQDIRRDSDDDADDNGIPDNFFITRSFFQGEGLHAPAPGATLTAGGGLARVLFEGDYQPAPESFLGNYELVLGGLLGERSLWRANALQLNFLDNQTPGVPDSYQESGIALFDRTVPDLEIVPGQRQRVDVRYCFSQVHLRYRTTDGVFILPRTNLSGSFTGTDFLGRAADYAVFGTAHGVTTAPPPFPAPSDRGQVTMCLPQGSYALDPIVNSINPNGGESVTQLRPVRFEVGCQQVIIVEQGLQLALDSLPRCTAESSVRLQGEVDSSGPVDRIFATVNGGPEVTYCTAPACGQDPAFDFAVPLAHCGNQVRVEAEAAPDLSVASTAAIRSDGAGPQLSGCADLAVDDSGGGATVTFEVAALDDCDGALPVSCTPPSGSLFPPGTTAVTCTAADACGNSSSCTFQVNVCREVEPDVRTQGFWKRVCRGPHPSGEDRKLPSYVDDVARTTTFAGVGTVAGLCGALDPQPPNAKCEQAEAQFMALLLNVAAGRAAPCNCLRDPDLGATTIEAVIERLDALLANPARTFDDCVLAQAVADRINNGVTFIDCP